MALHRSLTLAKHKRASTVQSADPLPSDLLIERFTSWKDVSKQLVTYFEEVVELEASYAKSYSKLAGIIEIPFKPAHQFMDKGGIQELFGVLRDKTHVIAEQHASYAKTLDSNLVKQANKIHHDIKSFIKDIQNDTSKLAANVLKDRENTTKALEDLASAIANSKNTGQTIPAKKDPFIVNAHVRHQMQKQVHDENLHQKSAMIMQNNSEKFEGEIIGGISHVWQTFEELSSKKNQAVTDMQSTLLNSFKSLSPSKEWNDFQNRKKGALFDAKAPLRDEESMTWPQMDDPAAQPVHKGMMERKKRYTRTYKESFYVVTPAGYLHEYSSSDPADAFEPEFSLYLPACTLGPKSQEGCKFHIEEGKNAGSSRGIRGTLGMKKEHEWSFKCANQSEMESFWEAIKSLCARHLQAVDAEIAKKEGIMAAVSGAGQPESPSTSTEQQPATDGAQSTQQDGAGSPSETSDPPGYTDQKDSGIAGIGAGPQPEKKDSEQPQEPKADDTEKSESRKEAPGTAADGKPVEQTNGGEGSGVKKEASTTSAGQAEDTAKEADGTKFKENVE